MNNKEINHLLGRSNGSKYFAKPTTCRMGHKHPSMAEAKHCWGLQAQMQSKLIKDLEWEKKYELWVGKTLVGIHKPDFTYLRFSAKHTPTGLQSCVAEVVWILCVDEVKGFRTADWVFRSKVFQALYPGIEYRVIG